MKKKCNFFVKAKANQKGTIEEQNSKLIKIFLKKWKRSGIVQELRLKSYPMTKGMKDRKKRHIGKRRAQKNSQK